MATLDVPVELLYRTSTLVESVTQIPPAAVHLRDRLFAQERITSSDLVSIETYKAKQRIAPFVSRFSKGHAVPRERSEVRLFSPAHIKEIRNLSADFLHNRGNPFAGRDATTRDVDLLTLDFQELDARISRTENKMCSDCLFTGRVKCLDGDTGELVAEIEYGQISETVTAKPWSDPTSDPLVDLKTAFRAVSGASGYQADIVIMSKEAGDAFESNAKVIEAYDKLRIVQGTIDPKYSGWGVVSLGTYRGIALTVDETVYENDAGVLTPFVPPKKVLVACSGATGAMAYAGVSQVGDDENSMSVFEGRRIPIVAYEKLEDYRKFRLTSRPIPVPTDLSSWTVLSVLV